MTVFPVKGRAAGGPAPVAAAALTFDGELRGRSARLARADAAAARGTLARFALANAPGWTGRLVWLGLLARQYSATLSSVNDILWKLV